MKTKTKAQIAREAKAAAHAAAMYEFNSRIDAVEYENHVRQEAENRKKMASLYGNTAEYERCKNAEIELLNDLETVREYGWDEDSYIASYRHKFSTWLFALGTSAEPEEHERFRSWRRNRLLRMKQRKVEKYTEELTTLFRHNSRHNRLSAGAAGSLRTSTTLFVTVSYSGTGGSGAGFFFLGIATHYARGK